MLGHDCHSIVAGAEQLTPTVISEFEANPNGHTDAKKNAEMFSVFYASGLMGLMKWRIGGNGPISIEEFMASYASLVSMFSTKA